MKNRLTVIILFIAFLISQWIIQVQRDKINMYKEYVEQIHENWTSSNAGWHKEIFIIPEDN